MSIRRRLELMFGSEPTDQEFMKRFIAHWLGKSTIIKIKEIKDINKYTWMTIQSDTIATELIPTALKDSKLFLESEQNDCLALKYKNTNGWSCVIPINIIIKNETLFEQVLLEIKNNVNQNFMEESIIIDKKKSIWDKIK